MNNPLQNDMQCSQFEAVLAEALDGALPADLQPAFDAHGQSCAACGPMLEEAREGMLLLGGLAEVEPPKTLVHNILTATSLAEAKAQAAPAGARAGWLARLFPSHAGRARRTGWAGVLQSRFVTSFCMAFFSLSLTLSLAGVRISDLAKIDWHPTALRKSVVLQYTQLEAKVARYYDNMRLVVEVESRVRDLKKAASPASDSNPNDNKQQQNRNSTPDTSGRPQDNENYSRERDDSSPQQARTGLAGDPNSPQQARTGLAGDPDGSLVAKIMKRSEGAEI